MIAVTNVRKRFGAVTALDSVSLAIAKGERVAIVGTNGSGKTTLLRAMAGLIEHEGTITIDGFDVRKDPAKALRTLAYAPQIAPPLEAPVGEVVRAHCALRGLDPARVKDRAARLGLELPPLAKIPLRDLSGGMKQKLLASLALASEAQILVCDEPTANLDPRARAAFFAEIEERPADAILVLCSHRVDEVRHLVQRVVELRDGAVVRDASLGDILTAVRSCRIDVVLREDRRAFLAELGFERVGARRYSGLFTQEEKLDVVHALLRDHGRDVADLAVFDEENGFAAPASGTVRAVGAAS